MEHEKFAMGSEVQALAQFRTQILLVARLFCVCLKWRDFNEKLRECCPQETFDPIHNLGKFAKVDDDATAGRFGSVGVGKRHRSVEIRAFYFAVFAFLTDWAAHQANISSASRMAADLSQ